MIFFIVTGGILGIIGSYMYYANIMSGYKLILATLLSTIKLFFFSQTIALEADYSFIYEIAKWLALLGTVLGIFSVFGDAFYKIRLRLKGIFAKKYIVVGGQEKGANLLQSILSANEKGVGYLLDDSSDYDDTQLVKKGIRRIHMDMVKADQDYAKARLKGIGLKKAESIIFFGEEVENMVHVKALLPLLPPRNRPYNVLMHYESEEIKRLMEEESDRITELDIRFFNTQKALASMILNRLLLPKEILSTNREPHIMIVGFDSLGEALFLEALNIAVIRGKGKIFISISDESAGEKMEKLKLSYQYIADMAEIQILAGANVYGFQEELKRIHAVNPIDILCFTGEIKTSLLLLHSMKQTLSGAGVAIYSKEKQGMDLLLSDLKEFYKEIFLFGDAQEVLGGAIHAEADLKKKAIEFNASYHRLAKQLMQENNGIFRSGDGDGREDRALNREDYELWNRLNTLKKESSTKLMMHADTKKKILDYYREKISFSGSREEFVDMFMRKLAGKTIHAQVDLIENDEIMNELAAI